MAKLIDHLLGNEDKTRTVVTLQTGKNKIDKDGGTGLTVRGASEPVNRASKRELKLAYLTDPIVFNGINKMVQVMLYSGYKLVGDTDSIKVVNDFLDGLGDDGGSDWESIKEISIKNLCVFGDAYAEKIYNKGKAITGLEIADPEIIDLARDMNQNVVLDKNNNPVGYVEALQPLVIRPKVVIPFPEGIDNPLGSSLFIPRDRMLHFRLYTTGDGINNYGLIEPIYKNVQMKKNIEDSFASFLARLGYPLLYGKIGDQLHEPTEDQIKNFLEDMKSIRNNDVVSVPYYSEIGILEPKAPERMQDHLDYFNNEIVSGLGIAKAFVTGSGEETNRATLARQEYLTKIGMKEILRRYAYICERELFKPLCEQSGLKTYPRMIWNEIALEELDSKANRLQGYANAGLITPNLELEKYVRALEELPQITELPEPVKEDKKDEVDPNEVKPDEPAKDEEEKPEAKEEEGE